MTDPTTQAEYRIIPKMLRGRLRHPPTCVNCNAPITLDLKGNWQHLERP